MAEVVRCVCPSRMPTEVTTVTRIEGRGAGTGKRRDDGRVDTFDEWCPRTEPVGFRLCWLSLSLSLFLSLPLSILPSLSFPVLPLLYTSVSSFSLFTVKWRNHRDVERLRRHDVNYGSVPRTRRQTAGSAWQEAPTENYNTAWERKRTGEKESRGIVYADMYDIKCRRAQNLRKFSKRIERFKRQNIKDYASFKFLIFYLILSNNR